MSIAKATLPTGRASGCPMKPKKLCENISLRVSYQKYLLFNSSMHCSQSDAIEELTPSVTVVPITSTASLPQY